MAAKQSAKIVNSFINFAVLQSFKNITGNLNIAPDYVIGNTPEDAKQWPAHYWGFRLGSYASFISSGIKNGMYSPAVVDTLANMGFDSGKYMKESTPYGPNKTNDALVIAASTYIRLYGDGVVPSTFVVPTDNKDWPSETWGMTLGATLSKMRSDAAYRVSARQQLIDNGISFESRTMRVDHQLYFRAVQTFHQLQGSVEVPLDYVVPAEDTRYEPEARGIKLGQWLATVVMNHKRWPDLKDQLQGLGVDFSVDATWRLPFDVFFSALCMFYSTHGHLSVPHRYSVPYWDPLYPEEAWGLPLGRALYDMRRRAGPWARHRERLAALGVGLGSRNLSFSLLYDSLVVFRLIHGHLDVVNSFVIPPDDERYPEEARGARLGASIRNIRLSGLREPHRAALEALGMDLNKRRSTREDFNKVYACLQAYKGIHGHLFVPHYFKVPGGDARYPEGSEGFTLGHTVTSIRVNNYHSRHRSTLQSLGFDFTEEYMSKVVQALLVYKQLHGDLKVPYKYTIAMNDEEYPEGTRGLGLWAIWSKYKGGTLRSEYAARLREVPELNEDSKGSIAVK